MDVLKATGHTCGACWKLTSLPHGSPEQLTAQLLPSPTHRSSHKLEEEEKDGKKRIQDKSTRPLAAQRHKFRCNELLEEAAAVLRYI